MRPENLPAFDFPAWEEAAYRCTEEARAVRLGTTRSFEGKAHIQSGLKMNYPPFIDFLVFSTLELKN